MSDSFFTKLAASGWHVPAKLRIGYRVVGRDAVPGGGVRIKIRGLPSGLGVAEWQLRLHPKALGRRGQRCIDSQYVKAKTLDDALMAAMAEAERVVERLRAPAAHVQRSPMPGPSVVAAPARPPAETGLKVTPTGRGSGRPRSCSTATSTGD